MDRLEANRNILRILSEEVERDPDIRFGQLLRNLSVVLENVEPMTDKVVWKDEFFVESKTILDRIEKCRNRRGRDDY